ncbi:MAG: nucleotidyltransferase family protein [Syntrophothermus sp.]
MKPTLLILAAGMGSRYGGLKQIDPIGPSGEAIIDYSIYDAIQAGFGKVVFIIKESIEKEFNEVIIKDLRDRIRIECVFQEIWKVPEETVIPADRKKPWGTGHAVLMAKDVISEPFAVINADDFYGRAAFNAVAAYYQDWSPNRVNDYSMVGYEIHNTLSEFGAVSRGVCIPDEQNFLTEVIERTKIERTPSGIAYVDEQNKPVIIPENTIVSMNFWGFTPSFFNYLDTGFREFLKNNSNDPKSEYYIPTAVNNLIHSRTASVKILTSDAQWFGMTYPEDRPHVVEMIKSLVASHQYPEKLWK